MKPIRYLPSAQRALKRHKNEAGRIMAKMDAYARDPGSQAANVKRLKGRGNVLRLRVGDFRVLFTESRDIIEVIGLGPRGSVYE